MGRRPLTLSSLFGVIVSLVLLAAGFQLSAIYSPDVTYYESSVWNTSISQTCNSYSTCGECSNNEGCGFCYLDVAGTAMNGSCAAALSSEDTTHSLYGRCSSDEAMTQAASGTGGQQDWAPSYCPSRFQLVPIFGLCFYLFFFAPGMGPMPWTVNSEIYPLWARGTCYSISTSVNWIFNLLVSMTFLTLIEVLTKYGAFYLYAGVALAGLILLYMMQPETRGKSLEEVEGLFAQPLFCRRRLSDGSLGSVVTAAAGDRTVQYVHIRGLNTRDRQDSNESGDDT